MSDGLKCDRCGEERILGLSGKTADRCFVDYKGREGDGYVPKIPNIGEHGYGDYIEMGICMECGKVQGNFPVSDSRIFKEIREM